MPKAAKWPKTHLGASLPCPGMTPGGGLHSEKPEALSEAPLSSDRDWACVSPYGTSCILEKGALVDTAPCQDAQPGWQCASWMLVPTCHLVQESLCHVQPAQLCMAALAPEPVQDTPATATSPPPPTSQLRGA